MRPIWGLLSEKHLLRLLLLLLVSLFIVYRSPGPSEQHERHPVQPAAAVERISPAAVLLSPSAAEEEALRAKVALLERQLAKALAGQRASAMPTTPSSSSSFQCSADQKMFQYENHDLVKPAICDTDSPWHLTQLALPDASVFIDIGANRGYTGARIFGLWSPGYNLNRRSLRELAEVYDKTNKQQDTVCSEASFTDEPLFCPGIHKFSAIKSTRDKCLFRRSIRVFSFEGQEYHASSVAKMAARRWPLLHRSSSINASAGQTYSSSVAAATMHSKSNQHGRKTEVSASWEIIHAALTGPSVAVGSKGFFRVAKDESGGLEILDAKAQAAWEASHSNNTSRGNEPNLAPVSVTTVDQFCKERGLDTVDVLKIDAEGEDRKIISGANETLSRRNVKMLTFECLACTDAAWQATFTSLDVELGFSCYVNGEHDTLILITQCWPFDLSNGGDAMATRPLCRNSTCGQSNQRPFLNRIDGNVYCVHRSRAAHLFSLLDSRALYRWAKGGGRGHVISDALMSYPGAFSLNDTLRILSSELSSWQGRTGRDEWGNKQWA